MSVYFKMDFSFQEGENISSERPPRCAFLLQARENRAGANREKQRSPREMVRSCECSLWSLAPVITPWKWGRRNLNGLELISHLMVVLLPLGISHLPLGFRKHGMNQFSTVLLRNVMQDCHWDMLKQPTPAVWDCDRWWLILTLMPVSASLFILSTVIHLTIWNSRASL